MAHIHGPAAPGANAPVLVPFSSPGTSPIKGTATLTDAQEQDLMDGKTYANVHTAPTRPAKSRSDYKVGTPETQLRLPLLWRGLG